MTERKRLFAIGDLVTRAFRPEYGIGLIIDYWLDCDYMVFWSGIGDERINGELFLKPLENPRQ